MNYIFSITAEELVKRGPGDIPREFAPASGLIYSSPATLTYNSPGAEGFGVKRAALVMPESAMLLVSPPCCGRNTTILDGPEYRERMFYLNLDEKDLVTGRYLRAIPEAVKTLYDESREKPKVVLICMTCVDALLGTDLPGICRKAEELLPEVRVLPCYMYALTREGSRPPMALVRRTIYSLLKRGRVDPHAVNLMGYFSPVADDSELYPMFRKAGITRIYEAARMKTMSEYQAMGSVNFNLVVDQESRFAADDLLARLGIPYVEISRQYSISRIARQYELLGAAVGVTFDDGEYRRGAEEALAEFTGRYPGLSVAVGTMLNANPFELSLMLLENGCRVPCIFAAPSQEDYPYLKEIARFSPGTRILMNTDASMASWESRGAGEGRTKAGDGDPGCKELSGTPLSETQLTLGRDAAWYYPDAAHVPFCEEVQPFGYAGLRQLLREMTEALEEKASGARGRTEISPAGEKDGAPAGESPSGRGDEGIGKDPEFPLGFSGEAPPASDISGAVSVLYEKGGMVVILDAGGCTGNVCGFDLPKWQKRREGAGTSSEGAGMIYSAGLRDLDAILGRDKVLLDKIERALPYVNPEFLALVGTPVSSVIGTDLKALARAAEKRFGLPVLSVPATGMRPFGDGERMAREALREKGME